MKLESDMWVVVVILGSGYLLVKYVQECTEKIKIRFRTKKKVESVIDVKITKKEEIEGGSIPLSVRGSGWASNGNMRKYPNSYIIICEGGGRKYTLNDMDTFEKYEVDDIIKLKLSKRIDKDGCVISYKIVEVLK